MYAYRPYGDKAPEHPEPRFPVPLEIDTRQGAFSWASLFSPRRDGKSSGPKSPLKSPLKNLAGLMAGRKTSTSPDNDKLEEILQRLDMLQNLVIDGTHGQARGSLLTSRRSSKRHGSDEEDGDDESEGSGTGRRMRPSLRRRNKSPDSFRYSQQDLLGTVADDAFRAATLEWQAQGEDSKSSIESRLKSSLKAGAKEAGKSSLRQVKHSLNRRSPSITTSVLSDASGVASPDPIPLHLSGRSSLGMGRLAAMMKGKRKEEAKHSSKSGKDEDGHKRFRTEYLHLPDDGSDIDEDLLEGLLPPAHGSNSANVARLPSMVGNGKGKVEAKTTDGSSDSHLRPLHFDPSLPSVQSFAWPDAHEIAEHARDGKEVDKSVSRSRISRERTSSSRADLSRSKGGKPDTEELMKVMMRSGGGAKNVLGDDSSRSAKSTGSERGKDLDMNALRKQMMANSPSHRSLKDNASAKIVELPDFDEDEPDMPELPKTKSSAGPSKRRGLPGGSRLDFSKNEVSRLGEADLDKMMREMMRSLGTSGDKDVLKEDTPRSKSSGHIPPPLDTDTRGVRLSSREHLKEQGGTNSERDAGDHEFGIAWPSTPTHEPGYDSLPEYVSPATEAFNRERERDRRGAVSDSQTIPFDERPVAPITTQDQVLFHRVVATMNSCLSKQLCSITIQFLTYP